LRYHRPVNAPFEVVELRRYVLHPGRRDDLIEIFEHRFVESQEACGMTPFGHYRDLDDPNAFVWLRGFPRMETRAAALAAFYGSPYWTDHRDLANATMVDSDNVLLLRSARPGSGFDLQGLHRLSPSEASASTSLVALAVFMLERAADDASIAAFEATVLPQLRACAQRVALLVTEERPNDFPRLPVREGEYAFVAAGVCPTPDALARWRTVLTGDHLPTALARSVVSSEVLRLEPGARSLYR
jgi:hypothetical protein